MRSMLAFILFAVSTLGGASDRTLVMPAMQPYFSDSGNAPYQRLTREIMRRSGSKIDTEYLPLAKSILMFDQNKNACYFAARELALGFLGYNVIDAGVATNRFKIVIATLKGEPATASVKSLRNRSVATLLGETLGVYGIPVSKITIHYVPDYEQGLKLLEKGRVQAIVGSAVDLTPYRDRLNFDLGKSIYSVNESIVCHPGPESQAFLDSVRPAIQSMQADGSLESILGKYYLLD